MRQKRACSTTMQAPGLSRPLSSLPLLAFAQWNVKPRSVVVVWLLYVLLVSAARYWLVRRYRRASPTDIDSRRWSVAFAVGAAMAAAGWVTAAITAVRARPANE